jgi:hypothetical protein
MTARWFVTLLSLFPLTVACAGEEADLDEEVGSDVAEISGGTVVPVGQLEAVGRIQGRGGCTGTLIGDSVVLTAAHCVCSDFDTSGCVARGSFTFVDVRPVSNPTIRQNVIMPGSFVVHPDMNIGGWLANDLAVLRLDQPASSQVLVAPMVIATTLPAVGSNVTLVGFGPTNGPLGECSAGSGVKRKAVTPLDAHAPNGAGNISLVTADALIHACPGDSGGPMLDAQGRVAGVSSEGDFATNSGYDATATHVEWIGLQGPSPGNRVGVWNLDGFAPAGPAYADIFADLTGLLGWIDTNDVRRVGDFLARGHDQILYINRGGAGGLLRIADYADGVAPTDSPYWESHGDSVLWNGWMDSDDIHLVGDFMGLGHDQLMLINRGGIAGRVMIISFAGGFASIRYFESYGDNPTLNGWHDAEDGFLVGDFMGDGHDQVLFVNRGLGNGRILIGDFSDGVQPLTWRYFEAYSDGNQLNGWHDAGDRLLAGDLRGLGHDQVMFVNRGLGDHRLLIADFSDGTFPAEQLLRKSNPETTILTGFFDNEDVAMAGDFRETGRDQVAFVNRTPAGSDRVKVLDFSSSVIVPNFVQTTALVSGLLARIQSNDDVLSGDLTGDGHAQLITLERLEQ